MLEPNLLLPTLLINVWEPEPALRFLVGPLLSYVLNCYWETLRRSVLWRKLSFRQWSSNSLLGHLHSRIEDES